MWEPDAWPLPVEAELHPVFARLTELGTAWAARRGGDWRAVLNHGRASDRGPRHRFRWQVVTEAVRFAAGRAPAPPADYPALPVGLRELLTWAVPAAVAGPPGVTPDLDRSRAAAVEADRLAAALAVPQSDDPPAHGHTGGGVQAREGTDPADPGELLAAALAAPAPADLPAGAAEVLGGLRRAPLPFSALRRIAAGHGVLPGTLLDALDAAAVRATGSPATRVEGHLVHLHADYAAALARGEDPLG